MKEVWSRNNSRPDLSVGSDPHDAGPGRSTNRIPPSGSEVTRGERCDTPVELGDGWIPFLHPPGLEARHRTPELWTVKQLASRFEELHELEAATGRELQDVLFSPVEEVGYYGTSAFDPDAFRQVVQEYESLGVAMTLVYIPAGTRDEYSDLLASFGAEMIGSFDKG